MFAIHARPPQDRPWLLAEDIDHTHTRRRRAALLCMRAPLSSNTALGFSLSLSRFASKAPSAARRGGIWDLLGDKQGDGQCKRNTKFKPRGRRSGRSDRRSAEGGEKG